MEVPVIEANNMAQVKEKSERSRLYPISKRLCDIGLSMVLLMFTLPLWGLIALAIKIDSSGDRPRCEGGSRKGSVFFVQQRVGQNGVLFKMYKFRTMYPSAPPDQQKPLSIAEKRTTRLGKYLRRFSLDELPQLLNVLSGEMSLVGPRPEMPFLVALYTPLQKKRLQVKPGITGLWQVCGRRDMSIVDGIFFDLYYIQKRSLLLDFEILIRTLPAVIRGLGAC